MGPGIGLLDVVEGKKVFFEDTELIVSVMLDETLVSEDENFEERVVG